MKIYLSHASSFDYQHELYLPIKQSQLFSQHEFILPHDNSHDPINTKEIIKQCNLIIAEVSYPSTGQGIELGWANFLNIPIFCLYRNERKCSSSLKLITHSMCSYVNETQMIYVMADVIDKLT